MSRFAGETACATTKDQHFVEHGGAGIQPARASFSSLIQVCRVDIRVDVWLGRDLVTQHIHSLTVVAQRHAVVARKHAVAALSVLFTPRR